jgi:hypothetical protein
MTRTVCPCGMPLNLVVDGEPIRTHGITWHQEHRARHLTTFPKVDERTRHNLDDAITWAAASA